MKWLVPSWGSLRREDGPSHKLQLSVFLPEAAPVARVPSCGAVEQDP